MLTPTLQTICNDRQAAQTLLVVTAEDLMDFAQTIVAEAKRMQEPEYMTRKEVMAFLGISERTLYNYEENGTIQAEMVGRQKRYDKSAIVEAVKMKRLKQNRRKAL